jgi:hypothetical protein
MATVKTKTGRLSITEEKMIYTRSGVRGKLAEKYQNLMKKMPVIGEKYRKVDQEIDLKDIRKIEAHSGIKGMIRPYFNVFLYKRWRREIQSYNFSICIIWWTRGI